MNDARIFPATEADRILRRAAEIEGAEDGRNFTLTELRSVAREAGFGTAALERAIGEAQHASRLESVQQPVQRSGLVRTRLSTMRTLPFELSSEQLTTAIRLFQPYRDGPVQVRLGEQRIAWRDRKGIGFTVTSAPGATEVRVYLSKFLVRRGKWMGWVKSAADGLEALLSLIADQGPSGQHGSDTRLLESQSWDGDGR